MASQISLKTLDATSVFWGRSVEAARVRTKLIGEELNKLAYFFNFPLNLDRALLLRSNIDMSNKISPINGWGSP